MTSIYTRRARCLHMRAQAILLSGAFTWCRAPTAYLHFKRTAQLPYGPPIAISVSRFNQAPLQAITKSARGYLSRA